MTLLQQIFEVDPLGCPKCHGTMRIVAFITQTAVIDQILTHLRTRAILRHPRLKFLFPFATGVSINGHPMHHMRERLRKAGVVDSHNAR